MLEDFAFYTLRCCKEDCSVLGMYAIRAPKRKCGCKLHKSGGEHFVAETCELVEWCIEQLGCTAQLYQEWYVLSANNKNRHKVDIVVQLQNGYVGIEVHGSKEHEFDKPRKQKDASKKEAWKYRMGENPWVTVWRPIATRSSFADGSWQQKHVVNVVWPALMKVM